MTEVNGPSDDPHLIPCGTVLSVKCLQVRRRAQIAQLETTTHVMHVWISKGHEVPRRGTAVYTYTSGRMVFLEWPGGRAMLSVARSLPVLPCDLPSTCRWLVAGMLFVGAKVLLGLHIVPIATRLARRSLAIGSDELPGIRAK
jgi:hypothetical protein